VIIAAAAFEDQEAEESRWRSKGWDKGDLVGWKKGSSWNKGDLGWGKGGCINCGKGWGNKGRWARSVDEEDDMTEEENKLRSHGGKSSGNLGGNHGGNSKLGGRGKW